MKQIAMSKQLKAKVSKIGKKQLKPLEFFASKRDNKLSKDQLTKLHGRSDMPATSPKPLAKGEEDYGQAVFDQNKKHLTVLELMKLLSKIKNPDKKRVWFDGSQYWGKLSGLRLFDNDREVLLEKGN